MVIDTSALVAIFLGEPEREFYRDQILDAEVRLISAATVLETGIVMETRLGPAAGREIENFIDRAGIEVVPFDSEQAAVALKAWRKYGKGRHPAGLNFGDCFSYALATTSGEPLLAKGSDFERTNLHLCPRRPSS